MNTKMIQKKTRMHKQLITRHNIKRNFTTFPNFRNNSNQPNNLQSIIMEEIFRDPRLKNYPLNFIFQVRIKNRFLGCENYKKKTQKNKNNKYLYITKTFV